MASERTARVNALEALLRLRRRAPLRYTLIGAALVAGLLLACIALVYGTGGTKGAFPHALYLPIALSAYFFGLSGSILSALIAGLAVGPAMPLDITTGEMQATANWVYRLAFYLLTGAGFGTTATLLHGRGKRLEDALRTVRVTQSATLKAFSSVVETHDDATGEHCERVALNARAMGKALNLSRVDLNQLYWAGILHDVGKVAVPTRILHKPAALTADEYELVKRHPTFGAKLLRSIGSSFEPIAVGVERHHERWDGSGYPSGLGGEQIPLFGRVLAIVDSFEAMTADRPYRAAMPAEQAMLELRREAGKSYDQELVAIYERLFRHGKIRLARREIRGEIPEEGPGAGQTLPVH
ncbi:MAG: HD-GYP domain-containing protein [Trueperaceae bacterium]